MALVPLFTRLFGPIYLTRMFRLWTFGLDSWIWTMHIVRDEVIWYSTYGISTIGKVYGDWNLFIQFTYWVQILGRSGHPSCRFNRSTDVNKYEDHDDPEHERENILSPFRGIPWFDSFRSYQCLTRVSCKPCRIRGWRRSVVLPRYQWRSCLSGGLRDGFWHRFLRMVSFEVRQQLPNNPCSLPGSDGPRMISAGDISRCKPEVEASCRQSTLSPGGQWNLKITFLSMPER